MTIAITAVVVILLVAIDQLTKYLVLCYLKPVNYLTLIDGILQFRYVENTGAAFGIFSDKTWALSVLTGVIIVIGFCFLFIGKTDDKVQTAALILILAGGAGNLIDRVARHFVVDFIEFTFVDFAVFNFADICVTFGAGLFILSMIIDSVRERKQENENADE